MRQWERWVEEAAEVASPLPEMGVVVFSVADAAEEERQEALVWAELAEECARWRERREGF